MIEMKTYTGTKTIKASPMTREQYCRYRGWDVPEDENPADEVYLVEYPEDPDSKPNHPDHKGYISMSPKHVFDKAYFSSETWLDRLFIEKEELEKKLLSLQEALKAVEVPRGQVKLLSTQASAMETYLKILEIRIFEANSLSMNRPG